MLQATQLGVHATHKRVEVHAHLATNARAGVERIHQEALAATDAAEKIDTARHLWPREHASQAHQRRALVLERVQLVVQLRQALRGTLLRRVQRDPAILTDFFQVLQQTTTRSP